jgi:hypothetical protein
MTNRIVEDKISPLASAGCLPSKGDFEDSPEELKKMRAP